MLFKFEISSMSISVSHKEISVNRRMSRRKNLIIVNKIIKFIANNSHKEGQPSMLDKSYLWYNRTLLQGVSKFERNLSLEGH